MRSGRLHTPPCPRCGASETRPAFAFINALLAVRSIVTALVGGCAYPTRAAWTCRACGMTFEEDAD